MNENYHKDMYLIPYDILETCACCINLLIP